MRTSVRVPHNTEINRSSVEKLAELGETDGVFTKAPDLDTLLP